MIFEGNFMKLSFVRKAIGIQDTRAFYADVNRAKRSF